MRYPLAARSLWGSLWRGGFTSHSDGMKGLPVNGIPDCLKNMESPQRVRLYVDNKVLNGFGAWWIAIARENQCRRNLHDVDAEYQGKRYKEEHEEGSSFGS